MVQKEAVVTDKAPEPLLFYSQGIKCQGMVYWSGQVGMDPETEELVEGNVADRAPISQTQEQCLTNLSAVLAASGSSIDNTVKITIYLTAMENFAALNKVYPEAFKNVEPKPVRTCVAVKELPFGTDVEMDCVAHL